MNKDNIILEALIGSHAYGLNTPESDKDYRGIYIPEMRDLHSPFKRYKEQIIETTPEDRQIFCIDKFFKLASSANPNILEILFVDEKFITKLSAGADLLRDNRNLFLSARCKDSYVGYAVAQLKRIRSHKSYLLNPVEVKPTREEYGLKDKGSMNSSDFYAMKSLLDKDDKDDLAGTSIMALYKREKEYRNALQKYKQYQDWKKNRNPKRAELERKYGFDLKHSSHLIRLLKMGEEILTKGTLTVNVGHDEDILRVKKGQMKYEELLEWAEKKVENLDELYYEKEYVVPESIDIDKIEELYFQVLDRHFFDTNGGQI